VARQATKDVDLQFVKGELITGKVIDKNTNEPIQRHGVHVARQNVSVLSSATDENGVYRLRAAPGRIMVFTSAPAGYEHMGQVNKEVNVIAGQAISDVDFRFEKSDSLSALGSALTFDGEPVAGAVITNRQERHKRYATSDKDGNFIMTGLRMGQKLSVKAEQAELQLRGYANLDVQPGAEVEILMEKYELTSVSGRVANKQGEPIPSAKIELGMHDKETPGRSLWTSVGMGNGVGEYRVTGLVIGDEYDIGASADGYRQGGTKTFTAAADTSLEDIVLLPLGSFFLEGTVTDTDGNPVVGARVMARSERHGMTQTDEKGHYRIDGLPFAVELRLNITHPDYGFSEFWYMATNQTQDFALARADGYLNGTVVDADGNSVVGARVGVGMDPDLAGTGHFNLGASTNGQGEFQLKDLLVNKTASVSVRKERLSKTFEDVEMNRDDVVFVLEKSSEPSEPLTAEETAKGEYLEKLWERQQKMPGQPAPELDVGQWLSMEPVKLADTKGKIVVLHFWSSQDARSVEAMRLINILQKVYGEKGLVCIGIHEFTDEIDELKKLVAEKKFQYRIAVDKELSIAGARGVTFDNYATAWTSTFILIDAKGVINSQPSPYGLEEKIRELTLE